MRKSINVLFLNLMVGMMPIFGFSQCPNSQIFLNSQADVDAFITNYPGCTQLLGGLVIEGADITDLSSLSVITALNTRLIVENNPLLTSLEGLNNVLELSVFFDYLRISNNDALTDISALSNMVYGAAAGSVQITNNPSLVSLNGLQGNVALLDSINIINNDALVDLDGLGESLSCLVFTLANNDLLESFGNLDVVTVVDDIQIINNPLLNDISALDNATNAPDGMSVIDNPNLSVCNVLPFCNRVDEIYQCCAGTDPYVIFENNAPGCDSVPEIAESCGLLCPDSLLFLNSQADIDAFTTNYPGCTVLEAGVFISGADITDLTPLQGVTTINLRLIIEDNPLLTSLSGLNNVIELGQVEVLRIRNNDVLTDISALSNMVYNDGAYGGLSISNNPMLTSLDGLQGNGSFFDSISIGNNDMLTSLDGLGDHVFCYESFYISGNAILQSFGTIEVDYLSSIVIQDNPLLNDVSALDSYTNGIYDISVINNPSLSVCNITPFCDRIEQIYECCDGTHPDVIFENNAPGCDSAPEIAMSCDLVPSNDECTEALNFTLGETLEAYDALATESAEIPACNDIDRADVWFAFNSEGYSSIDIVVSSGYNVQLWSGTCGTLSQVGDACGLDVLMDIPVTTNTDYYLQAWSEGSLGLFDVLVQDGLLSTRDFTLDTFRLYPNPTGDILYLKSESPITQVTVFDLLGKEIISAAPNAVNEEVNLTKLNSGMYMVTVERNSVTTVHRVVKE